MQMYRKDRRAGAQVRACRHPLMPAGFDGLDVVGAGVGFGVGAMVGGAIVGLAVVGPGFGAEVLAADAVAEAVLAARRWWWRAGTRDWLGEACGDGVGVLAVAGLCWVAL